MRIIASHRVGRKDLILGFVVAEGVRCDRTPPELTAALDEAIVSAAQTSDAALDERRAACRNLLRNGRYKPTGRGKPASEYLLRAARQGAFPRVNGPVDANNLVSLKHGIAISLWDLDLAPGERFEFCLGAPGDTYVFNPSGQVLKLDDLVCGYAVDEGGGRTPIVNPVKDSLATKTTPQSRRIAACLYCPANEGLELARGVTNELAAWLKCCGESTPVCVALCGEGEEVTLTPQ
jgi:DNA/RNA-binding domain of Phe-tRNA-synthetase-like protein